MQKRTRERRMQRGRDATTSKAERDERGGVERELTPPPRHQIAPQPR